MMNTKRVTKAGGVSIPVGLRRELGIQQGDAMDVEVSAAGDILLKRHQPRCVFCGTDSKVMLLSGKGICEDCLAAARR